MKEAKWVVHPLCFFHRRKFSLSEEQAAQVLRTHRIGHIIRSIGGCDLPVVYGRLHIVGLVAEGVLGVVIVIAITAAAQQEESRRADRACRNQQREGQSALLLAISLGCYFGLVLAHFQLSLDLLNALFAQLVVIPLHLV